MTSQDYVCVVYMDDKVRKWIGVCASFPALRAVSQQSRHKALQGIRYLVSKHLTAHPDTAPAYKGALDTLAFVHAVKNEQKTRT